MKIRLPKKLESSAVLESAKFRWFKFKKNFLSVAGLIITIGVILVALLAPYLAPYPAHAGFYMNLEESSQPPSLKHPFGTDDFGRDILSRVMFGFQYSMLMAAVILLLVIPPGVLLGLIAGYYRETWVDQVIMRISDIFIAVPPLVLALAICSVLTPSVFNSMMSVSLMWWPWYTRLTYSVASALKNEAFVQAAETMGASPLHIMFREILPNCLGPLLTKITLDVGWVILIGAALSYVGLGAQPPTPDLGTMVAQGGQFIPQLWWMTVFPASAIATIILGFNLLGDGIRDMFMEETM